MAAIIAYERDVEQSQKWLKDSLKQYGFEPGELQWKFRDPSFYYNEDDTELRFDLVIAELALCDAFHQGGYYVRTGDGASMAAQIVEAAFNAGKTKAEAADAFNAVLKSRNEDLVSENEKLKRELEELQQKPLEPPLGLLVSIAMRLDHSFLCKNFYETDDQFRRRQEILLQDAKRAWAEINGKGFWSPDNNTGYEVQYIDSGENSTI